MDLIRNIKLTIEYDGTNYNGWQAQASHDKLHKTKLTTIQGTIEGILAKIFHKKIHLQGSGRTDSGVHALGQVANLKIQSPWPLEKIKKAINGNLPDDIVVREIEEVPMTFHAQYSAQSKMYRYLILNRDAHSPMRRNHCLLVPYKLNLRLMKEEAKCLIGKKDFKAFQAAPSLRMRGKKEDSVRTVKSLKITKKDDLITLDIEANGFLHHMVRNIVGTLLETGAGKRPAGSFKRILKSKDRTKAGMTAPAWGLVLLRVNY